MTNVWCVRAEFGAYTPRFLDGGYVAIGWMPGTDLSNVTSRDELYPTYKSEHPDDVSNVVIGQQVGQIARFLLEIKAGDYVITPDSNTELLHYGLVAAGPSYFYAPGDDGCPYRHRRRVEWANIPLKRTGMSVPFQNTVRSLGYNGLSALNPRLIYVSISHFGQSGPRAHYKGNELIDYSFGGYTFLTGLPDREPIKAGGSQALYQGGIHAATGIMAALMLRELSGEGDYLDVSITEAICYAHANMPLYLNQGELGARVGARLTSKSPTHTYPSTILPCKGGFVHVHHAPADINLLGVLIGDPRFSSPEVMDTPRGHADEIDEAITKWMSQYDKYEAVKIAQELRHSFTMVLTPGDLPTDPQFVERGFFQEIDHPVAGPFKHVGGPVAMSETPWQSNRAPLLGEHSREILGGRLGLTDTELELLRSAGVS